MPSLLRVPSSAPGLMLTSGMNRVLLGSFHPLEATYPNGQVGNLRPPHLPLTSLVSCTPSTYALHQEHTGFAGSSVHAENRYSNTDHGEVMCTPASGRTGPGWLGMGWGGLR
jgi:hypothetical protein